MSYSIIFETKIINLKDGRILHISRSGCNNDDQGRSRHDFIGKIYSKENFIKYAESWKENSTPYDKIQIGHQTGFDMKIGSRFVSYYDYGEHLLRMLKRAEKWEDFDCSGRYIHIDRFDGIKDLGNGYQRRLFTELKGEDEVVNALDEALDNTNISFYIGKLSKTRKAV